MAESMAESMAEKICGEYNEKDLRRARRRRFTFLMRAESTFDDGNIDD